MGNMIMGGVYCAPIFRPCLHAWIDLADRMMTLEISIPRRCTIYHHHVQGPMLYPWILRSTCGCAASLTQAKTNSTVSRVGRAHIPS